jgi:hypothetical protein
VLLVLVLLVLVLVLDLERNADYWQKSIICRQE